MVSGDSGRRPRHVVAFTTRLFTSGPEQAKRRDSFTAVSEARV
jgi:hypothetical protein